MVKNKKRKIKDSRDWNNTIKEAKQQKDAQFSELEKLKDELPENDQKVMDLVIG